jgi:hypothetical protein
MNQLQVWNGDILRATYVTLKDAVDKINDGTWTGDLTIKINASTTESASVVLNASGTGSANYTRLLIYPQSSGISITGNINGPLLSLNGADNVTINGSVYLNNTSAGMTLTNTNAGTLASTVKFSESAQNNCIKYCVIKGNPASATQGVVLFSTASVGTGNTADTIAYCKISGTGATTATRPYNALYSAGTVGKENSGLVITGNEIFDFLNPGVASNGVLLATATTASTVSANSFYETAAFTPSAAVAYNVISIANTSGNGFTVSGNYIGGNAANGEMLVERCGKTQFVIVSPGQLAFEGHFAQHGVVALALGQVRQLDEFDGGSAAGAFGNVAEIGQQAVGDIDSRAGNADQCLTKRDARARLFECADAQALPRGGQVDAALQFRRTRFERA